MIAAIAVLIITCPCALALAVQVVACGALFRSGQPLEAGDAIERLAEADTIVFGKTGTLALPEPSLAAMGAVAPDVLERAARLALASHHPLARALARPAQAPVPCDDAVELPGQGITATLDGSIARLGSPAFCDLDAEAAAARAEDPQASLIAFRHGADRAVFRLRQVLRSDAAATIAALRGLGCAIEIAAAAMSASSILVTLNALRAAPRRAAGRWLGADRRAGPGEWSRRSRRRAAAWFGMALATLGVSLKLHRARALPSWTLALHDAALLGGAIAGAVAAAGLSR